MLSENQRFMNKNYGLQERVVLITGGSKGIGKAIASQFLQEDAKIIICARSKEGLESTEKELNPKKGRFLAIQADITDEMQGKMVLDRALAEFGGIDILVNNLGGAVRFGNLWEMTAKDWEDSFRLNVLSMVHITKMAIPHIKKSKFPRIITISSIAGVEPGQSNPHYSTMKAATINFTKFLANTLVEDRILVNVICPGPVHSDSLEQNILQTAKKKNLPLSKYREEFLHAEKNKIPLGRLGEGNDVARMVLFLASEEASWITGSCIHMNGGKIRSMC